MDLGLENKIDLVTGGSRGIGREIALSFAAEGARHAVTYHRERAEAERVAAQAADGIAVAMDLEQPATMGAAVEAVVARYGGIDVLVVNAVRWPRRTPSASRTRVPANCGRCFEQTSRARSKRCTGRCRR
jgi:NAD(P)-dependent dehydrogenase (short-subunit alcohol dehydrogenase family)